MDNKSDTPRSVYWKTKTPWYYLNRYLRFPCHRDRTTTLTYKSKLIEVATSFFLVDSLENQNLYNVRFKKQFLEIQNLSDLSPGVFKLADITQPKSLKLTHNLPIKPHWVHG